MREGFCKTQLLGSGEGAGPGDDELCAEVGKAWRDSVHDPLPSICKLLLE
jgi:hypothetical protein